MHVSCLVPPFSSPPFFHDMSMHSQLVLGPCPILGAGIPFIIFHSDWSPVRHRIHVITEHGAVSVGRGRAGNYLVVIKGIREDLLGSSRHRRYLVLGSRFPTASVPKLLGRRFGNRVVLLVLSLAGLVPAFVDFRTAPLARYGAFFGVRSSVPGCRFYPAL